MGIRVKVSSRHQITLPLAVRQQLGIEPEDQPKVDLRNGEAVLIPETFDPVARLKVLHREIWEGIDPQEYVNQERDAWEP